jgi:ABC-type microcin C transport system permease subunit YejE
MPDSGSLNHKAWMRFKRNKAAMFGLIVVGAVFFIAVFAYQLAPDHLPGDDATGYTRTHVVCAKATAASQAISPEFFRRASICL